MQLDIPLDGGTIVALAGFIGAVIFQSAMLKRSVEVITQRIGRIEEEMSQITKLLISNEGLTQRVAALTTRVQHFEDISLSFHAPKAQSRRRAASEAG